MPAMAAITFEIQSRSSGCHARTGRVTTPHGSFDTPAFAPVGTRATVKGLMPGQVAQLGAQVILANTYHLMLRPGSETIAQAGGLHRWMRWDRPIVTDSGGFQVFSLGDVNRITDEGVVFKSHLDGSLVELTPERSIQVQNELGADIIMAMDDCPPAAVAESQPASAVAGVPLPQQARHYIAPCEYADRNNAACRRSVAWLARCVTAHRRPQDQALFGIVQGGVDLDKRSWCVEEVCQHDLPGYAIGGVAVGEGYEGLKRVVEHTAPLLPTDRPRYLMGVGYERDILTAVRAGVDLFDCVLPTRNGRNANAFTSTGRIRLRNAKYAHDDQVIEPGCDCPACAGGFSRSYLRHLFVGGEMLGPILTSAHNIRHFQRYLLDIRSAITHNDWPLIGRNWPVAATENNDDTSA
jgi:queuine tRNA-ribosyltransferase